jgi:hypothetical protein
LSTDVLLICAPRRSPRDGSSWVAASALVKKRAAAPALTGDGPYKREPRTVFQATGPRPT